MEEKEKSYVLTIPAGAVINWNGVPFSLVNNVEVVSSPSSFAMASLLELRAGLIDAEAK